MNNLINLYRNYIFSQNKCTISTDFSNLINSWINHDKITKFLNGKLLENNKL